MSNERDREVKVDPEIAEDPNYIAYVALEPQLKIEHMGKWVAFVAGRHVITSETESELYNLLDTNYPEQDALIQQILDEEPIINLGGACHEILD